MTEPFDQARQRAVEAQDAQPKQNVVIENISGTERSVGSVSVGRFKRYKQPSPFEGPQPYWVSENTAARAPEGTGLTISVHQSPAGDTDLRVRSHDGFATGILRRDRRSGRFHWQDVSADLPSQIVSQHSLGVSYALAHQPWSQPAAEVNHTGIVRVTNTALKQVLIYRINAGFKGQPDNWNVNLSTAQVQVIGV